MKNIFKRHWPLLGLGLILVTISVYLLKSGEKSVEEVILEKAVPKEGLKLEDIRYTQDDPAKGMKWVMEAKEVNFTDNNQFVTFREFQLRLDPENRPAFSLRGERGEYSRAAGEIKLMGGLEGSSDGYRIVTDQVLINEKTGKMSSDQPVKIFGSFFRVEGRGFSANLRDETIKILSDAKTTIEKRLIVR